MPYRSTPPSVLIAATSTANEAFFLGTGKSALASKLGVSSSSLRWAAASISVASRGTHISGL
jgi:hypothetical protein